MAKHPDTGNPSARLPSTSHSSVATSFSLTVRLRRLERLASRDRQVAASLATLRRALGLGEAVLMTDSPRRKPSARERRLLALMRLAARLSALRCELEGAR
jgi:hypothetical protein